MSDNTLLELREMYYRMLDPIEEYRHVSDHTPNEIKHLIQKEIDMLTEELDKRGF